ncbi:putative DEAD/DEAH box helicase [Campylobacter phage F358]|uniref:Putative DEAD/DEAH box helicase n=4 Tax=Fletchervirus CPX TaxID=1110702 RepID=A0A7T3KEX8_9CAUD|nr:putative DEAD/DEAH box helicase [Campylobacter phage F357]QPX63983.1 putative DEAD/DEAH box helicase [Campylobacter phage F358]QPX64145.1 putative DEAD/DEAH box helicase [Campylobacter phage F360]QPX64309.1 putative DEAD/DEAH box helicase [Campylobacter phage F361]
MKYIFTVIDNTSKTKVLKTDIDNKVNFRNVICPSINSFAQLIESNFILSRPIHSNGLFKRKRENMDYLHDCGYIILDLDKVTKGNFQKIIDYFKNTKWECLICNSRSYNFVDNFNLKVICKIDYKSTDENIRNTLLFFKEQLKGLCSIDESATRHSSYQAPSLKVSVFYKNENDIGIPFSILPKSQSKTTSINCSNKQVEWCLNYIKTKLKGNIKEYVGYYSINLPSEKKSKYSYCLYETNPFVIFHPNPSKNINILQEYLKTKDGKAFLQEKQSKIILSSLKYTPDIHINQKFLKNIDIPDTRVVCIKSPMGSGKSNIINQYIKDKSKILFISVRQTLAKDISLKYGCKYYLEDKKILYGENYVCQINSLHKINLDYFDYVILDEFETLLMYIVTSIEDSPYALNILRKFYNILNSKYLLILDAFLSDHSNILSNVCRIKNHYKDQTNVSLYTKKNTFFSVLEYVCKNKNRNEVVTMSFSTLSEFKTVESLLIKSNLKVISINSNTNRFIRDNIFTEYFKKKYVNYDCILFSPSITVGVSIMNNISHHFHFDNSASIDAITSIQMVKRSRLASNIHIFVEGSTNMITPLEVEKNIIDSFEIDDLEYLSEFYNKLCYYYETIELNHKMSFCLLLQDQFSNINIVDSIVNYNIVQADISKEIELNEFENSKIKDELIYAIKKDKNYLNYIRNFKFYTLNKNKNEFLENYLLNNPSNLLELSHRAKFLKYCVTYPDIRLKDIFTYNDIQNIKYTTDYFSFTNFLKELGYKKMNGNYYLPLQYIKHLSKI